MFSYEEMTEGLPEFMRLRAGMTANPDAPPAARRMHRSVSLSGVRAATRDAGSGYGTPDFSGVLGDGVRELIVQTYAAAGEHRAFCRPIPVRRLSPTDLPAVDLVRDLPPLPELSELRQLVAMQEGGERAQLQTFGGRLLVSRQTFINDDVALIMSMVTGLGVSTAATEATMLYALLEGNPNLRDEAPWFHVDYGNLLTGHALTDQTLAAAMSAMRKQATTAGNLANHRARFIVVAPELEVVALALVRSITTAGDPPLTVIASPWLATGHWYLLADPDLAPTVGRLYLDHKSHGSGEDDAPVIVAPVKERGGEDGIVLAVVADLGVTPLSRVGIVRCEP